MARRSTPEKPSVLLSAAQNAEQSDEPDCDAATLASLKQIIENHVAALEILQTVESQTRRRFTPAWGPPGIA